MKRSGPALLILSGAPGAGKTRLAPHLSAALGLPVIAKDALKEALMDHLGGGREVGAAAFAVQFAVAEALLTSGQGVILEGAFFRDSPELTALATGATAVVVHLEAPPETLLERYRSRAPDRHPGHRGLEALSDLRERVESGMYDPAAWGLPLIRVESLDVYRPGLPQILAFVRTYIS